MPTDGVSCCEKKATYLTIRTPTTSSGQNEKYIRRESRTANILCRMFECDQIKKIQPPLFGHAAYLENKLKTAIWLSGIRLFNPDVFYFPFIRNYQKKIGSENFPAFARESNACSFIYISRF